MGERMAGKVVLVSGGGSRGPGIGNGRASAILCAREGARVAVFDIDKDAAAETKRMIDDEDGEAIVVTGDVSIEGDCERAVAETVDAFSRLDVLVNVVGIVGPPGNAPDLDIAEDRFVTATGSYSATASLGGSAAWVMQVATFKAAS